MLKSVNYKKLAKQVASIDNISKKNKWLFQYDSELDNLYFSPLEIKKGYSLIAITDEFSVYVDSKSNLGGVFVEYYQSNLTVHDKKFKPFKKIFTNKKDFLSTIPKNNKKDAIQLSELIKAEILSDLITSHNIQFS